jgi:hypothetical protein
MENLLNILWQDVADNQEVNVLGGVTKTQEGFDLEWEVKRCSRLSISLTLCEDGGVKAQTHRVDYSNDYPSTRKEEGYYDSLWEFCANTYFIEV